EIVLRLRRRSNPRGRGGKRHLRRVLVQAHERAVALRRVVEELGRDEAPDLVSGRDVLAGHVVQNVPALVAVDGPERSVARAVEHDDADGTAVVHDRWPRVDHVAVYRRTYRDPRRQGVPGIGTPLAT